MATNNKVHGNSPPPPQKYVSALRIEASDDSDFFPTGTCVDNSGDLGSPDCNNGFGGKYTYVVKSFTTDQSRAITGLSIEITPDSEPTFGRDMAQGTGGDYRYVVTSRDLNLPTRISEVQLWRSPNDSITLDHVRAAGWHGISTDINHRRSGAYLYLVWKNVWV